MKIFLLTFLAILLISCSSENRISPEILKHSKFLTNSDTCPVGMGTIFATGTKIAIDCYEFEKPKAITISAEVDYAPQKNLINLSMEESEEIVRKLLLKGEEELKKEETTRSLIQGDWKAIYNPPKYPDGFDSIVVTMSGKTYVLPGVYGKEERARYLERIGAGTGCVSYVQGSNPEQGTENVLINGKYYYPPNHGDCMSGVRTFRNFDGFSPSGYYLIYHVSGWEWAEVIIFDIQTGKNILENSNNDSRTLISWTPDSKRMLYYTEGWDNEKPSGVYITRIGNFPIGDKVVTPGPGGLRYIYADDKYIYMLEEYTDYYLRIFDINSLEEVYSRIVKK